ncbi:MAG: hypothetical protein JWL94_1576 [Microbacteriaceae bacterium]|jgi:hypothetical protein|nr:hypothetical protein [Microbacteriaceae bacterium]
MLTSSTCGLPDPTSPQIGDPYGPITLNGSRA